ncbi:MAG: LamG domain-containing protein [Phycisphaerae bacterium]
MPLWRRCCRCKGRSKTVARRDPVLRWDDSKAFDGKSVVEFKNVDKLLEAKSMTWSAWFKTEGEGTIVCLTRDGREWVRGGGTLFVRDGNLVFDIGWVGQTDVARDIADGKWHHVAVTIVKQGVHFYLDGEYTRSAGLAGIGREHRLQRFKIGFTNDDFPKRRSHFTGEIKNVVVYDYAMPDAHVKDLYEASR